MKKIISFVLSLCIIFTFCTSAFAAGVEQQPAVFADYLTEVDYNEETAARDANPPSSNNVWDWGSGTYYGHFEMKKRVFTNYVFTGYSSYTISASLSCGNAANKTIGISVYNTNKKLIDSVSTKNSMSEELTVNVDPGAKIYVAISHEFDDFTASGWVSVKHG